MPGVQYENTTFRSTNWIHSLSLSLSLSYIFTVHEMGKQRDYPQTPSWKHPILSTMFSFSVYSQAGGGGTDTKPHLNITKRTLCI